jgi:uncharacterized peroxidase-related enzyme
VAQIASQWRQAGLSAADRALCEFAEKLTRAPQDMREADVRSLREAGFADRAIHDATQVVAYFNYINRVADALGIEHEDFVNAWERVHASPARPPRPTDHSLGT